jgi:hypothetical protein
MGKLEEYQSTKLENERQALVLSMYGALVDAVAHSGGQLERLSVRWGEGEVLMVLCAKFPSGWMVGFVGAQDLPAVFVKATREAGRDLIRWREDEYRE